MEKRFSTKDYKKQERLLSRAGLKADEKNVEEVMEVVRAAMLQSGITYVDFNTGHYEGETYLDLLEPYIRAIKDETGLLVGVQTPPHGDLQRYDALKEMGVNRVSFCFEIFDRERFVEVLLRFYPQLEGRIELVDEGEDVFHVSKSLKFDLQGHPAIAYRGLGPVINLAGGMIAWNRARLPIEQRAPRSLPALVEQVVGWL